MYGHLLVRLIHDGTSTTHFTLSLAMEQFYIQIQETLGPLWPLLIFVLILLLGYVVAKIAEGLVRAGIRRLHIDDRIAKSLAEDEPRPISAQKLGGRITFWVVLVLAFVAAFEAVNLASVSQPLAIFAERVIAFLPQLIGAAILASVAFVVGSILRIVATHSMRLAKVDQRIERARQEPPEFDVESAPEAEAESQLSISKALGDALYYFVLLLFLPAILEALGLSGILGPVQGLVNELVGFLPNVALAIVIVVVGAFAARVLRKIVTNLLAATGTDRVSERVGLTRATGVVKLSDLLGLVVYVLVLVPVIVAALNALQVDAVTAPASAMLDQFLQAIPMVFVAALILLIAYVVGRLLASLVTNVLTGVGFNRLFEGLGFRVVSSDEPSDGANLDVKSPAGIAGLLVLISVMLFAATEAAASLNMNALAVLISEFTVLGGKILMGLLIFGIGLYLANLAYSAIRASGTNQAAVLAMASRVSIMVLAAAMALRQMGLADSIINLAFGLVLGAVAVAAAIAFGMGGRDVAREQLEKLRDQLDDGEGAPSHQ